MTMELMALFIAGGMLFVTILIQQLTMSATQGAAYSLSNRDTPITETPFAGRLRRAAQNGVESVAIYAPLVCIAIWTDAMNGWTYWAAAAFAVSRLLYLPSYALGLVPVRTLVWSLGFFALPFFAIGLFV